jgi:hypothetical protein
MPTPNSLSESVSLHFKSLQTSSQALNALSDELGKAVSQIDDGLKKLNLGVTVWVKITGDDDAGMGGTEFWSEDLGYAKLNGKWGVCLRKCEGDYQHIERENVEAWLFSDAPRLLRLSAIDKFPELIQQLNEATINATKQLMDKLGAVAEIANAVNPKGMPRPPKWFGAPVVNENQVDALAALASRGTLEELK